MGLSFFLLGKAAAFSLASSYWQTPVVPIRVQMGPASIVLADGSTGWNSVVINSLELWNEQMDQMQFSWTTAAPGTAASFGDGVNSVQFSDKVYGDDFGENVLAVTLGDASGNRTIETDVLFNTANRFNSYRGTYAIFNGISYFDLHRISLHEFGHVLGLDHPDEHGQTVDAIMNAHISTLYALQADDVAGGVALYGAPPDAPKPEGNAQILQISTRGSVGTGDEVMIGGFIIQGTAPKKVIVRAIGPSLGDFGVTGALKNPKLDLYDGTGALLASDDDWRASQEQEIIDTALAPSNDLEAAVVADLAPGSYTAIVSGASSGTGVALVEVYDLQPENGKLGNISTRAQIGAGDDVMIGGFIIQGPQSQKNIIRALGQSLGSVGVVGAITNPMLELYNSNGDLLQANDDFGSNREAGVIRGYGLGLVNGFESGLYFEGAPGNFTAIMRGVNGATGIGLIEVYAVE
ncbi:hypothetical protein BH20VER3_BH20VER3_20980 [soil metagenome]